MGSSAAGKFNCINCGQCCKEMDNLALFEWEKDRLLKLDPSIGVFPGNKLNYKGTDIIPYWGLKSRKGQCPFLESKNRRTSCRIYGERPFVCKSFPLSHSGHNSIEDMIATNCPASVVPFKENEKISKVEFYRKLHSAYGETFESVFRLDLARVWVSDVAELVISHLEENQISLEDKEIGLFKLGVREGVFDREFIDSEIENLESLDVEEILNSSFE